LRAASEEWREYCRQPVQLEGGDACHAPESEWSSRSCSPMRDCASNLRSTAWRRSPNSACAVSSSHSTRSTLLTGPPSVCGSLATRKANGCSEDDRTSCGLPCVDDPGETKQWRFTLIH